MAEKSEADKRYEILAEFNLVPSSIFPLNKGVHCTVSSGDDEAIGNRKLTSKSNLCKKESHTMKSTKIETFLVIFKDCESLCKKVSSEACLV